MKCAAEQQYKFPVAVFAQREWKIVDMVFDRVFCYNDRNETTDKKEGSLEVNFQIYHY